jgi:hypothetical protein
MASASPTGSAAASEPVVTPPTLRQIADHEYLLEIANHQAIYAGQAPGPDRVRHGDLGPRERAAIMRSVSEEILAGTYEPSRARRVPIAKPSGGFRVLSIRSILFRIVSAALAIALDPYWDPKFLDSCHGFRPGRGPWSMLVHLERIIMEQERFVFVQDDVRKAFDNVPIDYVMGIYQQHHEDDPAMLDLMEKVLRGHTTERREVGIDQGSALSPRSLNATLHHVLDKPFSEDAANPPGLRYVDNKVYLCRSVSEGQAAIQKAESLLESIGMSFKGEYGPPVDLRSGQGVVLLGLDIRWKDGQIQYGLAKRAWKGMEEGLREAHEKEDPNQAAREAVRGWITYCGPAFEGVTEKAAVSRILQVASQVGFRELNPGLIRRWVQSARDRWQVFRRETWQRKPVKEGIAAAPHARI